MTWYNLQGSEGSVDPGWKKIPAQNSGKTGEHELTTFAPRVASRATETCIASFYRTLKLPVPSPQRQNDFLQLLGETVAAGF